MQHTVMNLLKNFLFEKYVCEFVLQVPKSYLASNYTLMLKQCTEWRCQEGQNILGQGRGRKMVYLLWDL